MASQSKGNSDVKTNFESTIAKDKGKRPASSPPPTPAQKRQDTKTNLSTAPTKPTATKQPKHLSYKDLPPNWSPTSSFPTSPKTSPETSNKTLQLTYHKGNIFTSCPPHTLLIHACNTQGHWGAGIAKAFKQRYPIAYKAHHNFCTKHSKTNPVATGTSQLLAPVDAAKDDEGEGKGEGEGQWIGCVFTSARYGKAKDKKGVILGNTGRAMEMLLELVRVAEEVEVVRMCKINSGKFGVPWGETEGGVEKHCG